MLQRPEIVLEKLARAVLVERDGGLRALANVLERRGDLRHLRRGRRLPSSARQLSRKVANAAA